MPYGILLMRGSFIAGIVSFTILTLVTHFSRHWGGIQYEVLADALMHGHTWITQLPSYPGITDFDPLIYYGKKYVIEGPLPAILLMPLVALRGISATAGLQELLGTLLTAIASGTAWEIARHFKVQPAARVSLCGFLILGTAAFWCGTVSWVWELAHISSFTFTLLALLELLRKRRAWLVVIYAVCAAESRFPLVFAIPVYAAWLSTYASEEDRLHKLRVFGATLAPFVLLWIAYNQARWGLPYDVGYQLYYHIGDHFPPGSPFRFGYFPYQVYSFFMRPPAIILHSNEIQAPFLAYNRDGIALTWTSPALLLVFLARESRLRTLLWTATALVAIPSFLYYANGAFQLQMRHAMDFEPFLFVLMAAGIRDRMPRWGTLLCWYSIFCGIWMLWYWNTYWGSSPSWAPW